MQAGRMRERVQLKRPTIVQNDAGQDYYRYNTPASDTDTFWAAVRNVSQSKGTDGEQLPAGTDQYEIRCRYNADVAYDCRLEWNGYTLEITAIDNVRNLNHEMVLRCEVVDL